ncbi:septum site-determining protein MinC [Roseibium sp. AS2]|uniref:septum site-determining protein MinC n=1 Tax=Roseibium sp. AS2 TaxID=3135781 RepID=UPI00317A2B81
MKFKGKSFIAIVLSPELPFADWFGEIDRIIARTPGFFIDRPIVLDVRGSKIPIGDLEHLLEELGQRSIRVMGIDGVAGTRLKPGMPPSFSGGRLTAEVDVPEPVAGKPDAATDRPDAEQAKTAAAADKPGPKPEKKPIAPDGKDAYPDRDMQAGPACIDNGASIVITEPVRSGQSILHPDGDVTVIGSVSSGAEIIAGGSIHVYGALRGRALAGVSGKDCARIFCSKFEAELVSINGLYKVADDFDATLRNAPAQIRFENETLVFEQLN